MGKMLIVLLFISRSESNYVTDSQKVLDFANYLYESHNYHEAITEYERSLFLGADTSQILLQLGRAELILGEYEPARQHLQKIENDTSFLLLGFSWLEERDMEKAQAAFSQIKDAGEQERIKSYYSKLLSLPQKSPLFAGLSSAIIPGTGRIYSGRLGDGIFASFFTIGSSLLSYHYYKKDNYPAAIGFGIVGFLFYLGDIYGSVKSTKLYNQKVYQDELNHFKRNLNYLY